MTVQCPRCGTRFNRPGRSRVTPDTHYRCARCRHVFEAPAEEPTLLEAVADEEPEDDTFRFDDEEESEDPPTPRRPARDRERREGASPARFALRALLLVTLGYATLSVYIYTHPERMHALLDRIPVLGPALGARRIRPSTIQLAEVHGEYLRVKGDRLVFVISGKATNDSPVPVRGIQIEGRITGATEQRQVVFCGAAPREVENLSLREIALLQTLEPPKDWALAPGEQVDFAVVFAGPPTDLREFAAEVVAVQAPGRPAGALARLQPGS